MALWAVHLASDVAPAWLPRVTPPGTAPGQPLAFALPLGWGSKPHGRGWGEGGGTFRLQASNGGADVGVSLFLVLLGAS